MIGGAVGDAMGFPTECFHYETIRQKYGKVDGLRTREGCEGFDPPVNGPVYTDDTVMKHMVCEAIFESDGHPTVENIADVWKRTITKHDQWWWWNNTRVVAMKLQMNPLVPLREIGRDSIACDDAAMIIGPIGIINAGDPVRAAVEAWDISSIWQNGYSRECAAAMAACHAEALRPGATIESIVETARKFSPTMKPYIDEAMDVVANSRDADDFIEQYYKKCLHFPNEEFWNSWCEAGYTFGADPLEVCTEALAFLVLAKGDGRIAMTGAANFGRDCDTIAGIAGAFCGALSGCAAIPADWIRAIDQANPAVDIKDYSSKLYKIVLKNLGALEAQVSEMRTLVG